MKRDKEKKERIEVHFPKEVVSEIDDVAKKEKRSRKNFCEYSILKNLEAQKADRQKTKATTI